MDYIPGYGPSSAKLMVLGEQPYRDDLLTGLPFSGNPGKMVKRLLEESGIAPESVYYSYVIKTPTALSKEDRLKGLAAYSKQVIGEIEALRPNCILGLGNVPLTFLTGHHGIDQFRGSIYQSNLGPKFVGTLHPYSLRMPDADGKVKSWTDSTYIKWDMKRAIEQSKFSKHSPPKRNLIAATSSHQLWSFFRQYADFKYVSVDIETFKTFPICISFAFTRNEAISVPLLYASKSQGEEQMNRAELANCWQLVAKLLADPNILKVGQNFSRFDMRLLERCNNDVEEFGLITKGFFFDTNLAFKTLFPELPGRLQFMTSVLTEEPYYKDEGKEYNPKKDKLSRLLLYNAKDAVITFECFECLVGEMSKIECWPGYRLIDFFFERVMSSSPFYSRMERRGILRDNFMQKVLLEKYTDKCNMAQETLDTAALAYWPDKELRKYKNKAGKTQLKRFNSGSNAATGEMKKLVYGYMGCPARKGTDETTLDGLIRNGVKDPDKIFVLKAIANVRKIEKVLGTYICAETDHRGRLLTSINQTLETGRTSTRVVKSPVFNKQVGLAFQTITKHGEEGSDIRAMMVPDEGTIFFESDLSQAEARVVAILANDTKLNKMFSYGVDVHLVTTGWIEGCSPDELLDEFFALEDVTAIKELVHRVNQLMKTRISSEKRQIGKKFRHAGHYDMGKHEASKSAGLPEWRAGQILNKFHATNPNIQGVFHADVIKGLQDNNRVQVTPHGRRRQFLNEWGRDLFKEAYANIPQGTVSDHLKFAAQRIEFRLPWVQMLVEAHDSFMCQVPLAIGETYPFKFLDKLREVTKEEMEVPIDFRNCSIPRGELIIPCDMAIGTKSWLDMEKI